MPFTRKKRNIIPLCSFAINEDGADKLSSVPPFQNFWIRHCLPEGRWRSDFLYMTRGDWFRQRRAALKLYCGPAGAVSKCGPLTEL